MEHVNGKPIPFSNDVLKTIRDANRLQKLYKLETDEDVEAYVLGSMAIKGS